MVEEALLLFPEIMAIEPQTIKTVDITFLFIVKKIVCPQSLSVNLSPSPSDERLVVVALDLGIRRSLQVLDDIVALQLTAFSKVMHGCCEQARDVGRGGLTIPVASRNTTRQSRLESLRAHPVLFLTRNVARLFREFATTLFDRVIAVDIAGRESSSCFST